MRGAEKKKKKQIVTFKRERERKKIYS